MELIHAKVVDGSKHIKQSLCCL